MPHRVCPWWIGYLLAGRWRRWRQDPDRILAPYLREGMRVLEPGPGMGYFTLPLARMAGPTGRVVAVDIQPKMLEVLRRRARKAGLLDRIETRLVRPDSLVVKDLAGQMDFALAFAMVHELPAAAPFFAEIAATLKPGGLLLLAEPKGHVKEHEFAAELQLAGEAGLRVTGRPPISASHAAVLQRTGGA